MNRLHQPRRSLNVDHDAVMEYLPDGASCVLTFRDAEPLQLTRRSATWAPSGGGATTSADIVGR